jgi:hypothetical protein
MPRCCRIAEKRVLELEEQKTKTKKLEDIFNVLLSREFSFEFSSGYKDNHSER